MALIRRLLYLYRDYFAQDARYVLFRCINKIVVDIYVQYFRLEKIERIVYSI